MGNEQSQKDVFQRLDLFVLIGTEGEKTFNARQTFLFLMITNKNLH